MKDEDSADSAVTLYRVIDVAVNRISMCNWVVEKAVLDHHLRLDETRLRPFQGRQIVAEVVVTDANAPLGSPMCYIGEPILMIFGRACARSAFPGTPHFEAFGAGDLLPFRIPRGRATGDVGRILRQNRSRTDEHKRERLPKTGKHIGLLVSCPGDDRNERQYKTFKWQCP